MPLGSDTSRVSSEQQQMRLYPSALPDKDMVSCNEYRSSPRRAAVEIALSTRATSYDIRRS